MPTVDVADAYGYLETVAIPETVELLFALEKRGKEFGLKAIQEGAHEVAIGLLRDVNDMAVRVAGLADGVIVAKILETRAPNRPHQGILESHIRSEPGPLGLVKVAMLEELDRAVNPNGYGPFWRAQEYGTNVGEGGYGGGGIETQIDRVLYGVFEPSNTPPDADQAGHHKGSDLAFVPGGESPGYGTIGVDLPGRHFLRDGFAEAGERYKLAAAEIQSKWDARLRLLLASLKREVRRSGGGFIGIIEA